MKEKNMNNADGFNISQEEHSIIFKKIQAIQSGKKPEAGDVWHVDNFGRVLILKMFHNYCRYVFLSNNTHFAMNYDLVFTDRNVSFKELAAHTHFSAVIPLSRLSKYDGTLDKKIYEYLLKADRHIKDEIPEGAKPGEAQISELYDEWSDLIYSFIDMFSSEAAEIAEKTPRIFSIADSILKSLLNNSSSEIHTAGYRLAADSKTPFALFNAETMELLSNDNIKVTCHAAEDSMIFSIFLADDSIKNIEKVVFSFNTEKKLRFENLPVELNEAGIKFNKKNEIEYFLEEKITIDIKVNDNYSCRIEL